MKTKRFDGSEVKKEIDLRTLDLNEELEIIVLEFPSPVVITQKHSKLTFPIFKWKVLHEGEVTFLSFTPSVYNTLKSVAFPPNSVLKIKKVGETQVRNGTKHEYEFTQGGRIWRNFKKKIPLPFNLSIKEVEKPTSYEQSVIQDFKIQSKAHGLNEVTREQFVDALVNQANIKKERAEMLFDHWY